MILVSFCSSHSDFKTEITYLTFEFASIRSRLELIANLPLASKFDSCFQAGKSDRGLANPLFSRPEKARLQVNIISTCCFCVTPTNRVWSHLPSTVWPTVILVGDSVSKALLLKWSDKAIPTSTESLQRVDKRWDTSVNLSQISWCCLITNL